MMAVVSVPVGLAGMIGYDLSGRKLPRQVDTA